MWSPGEFKDLITTLGIGGGLGGLGAAYLQKLRYKNMDAAQVEQLKQETKKVAVDTVEQQLELLKEVHKQITDTYQVRVDNLLDDKIKANELHAQMQVTIDENSKRISKLEERERHMLTRAAVHEAWDQLAWKAILLHDAQFQPPPPILNDQLELELNVDAKARSNKPSADSSAIGPSSSDH